MILKIVFIFVGRLVLKKINKYDGTYLDNASLGQFITQSPQPVHASSKINGRLSTISIASNAQTVRHTPSLGHTSTPLHLSE